MLRNRSKKPNDSTRKQEETYAPPKDKIIKFNLSYDNLKCFINEKPPKTDRKHVSTRYDFSMTDSKRYKEQCQQKQALQCYHNGLVRSKSPEPYLTASNEILQRIQKNGLKFVWNEIEEAKTEGSSQEEWREKELLNQTFSECSSSYGKNVSHASTIDQYSGYFYQNMGIYQQQGYNKVGYIDQTQMAVSQYIMAEKTRYYNSSVFEINPKNIGNDTRTTLMIKNIPNKYTIEDLSYEIDQNFKNSYDFLYLPCDLKNGCNVGYGFINFISLDVFLEFYKKFHNKKWQKFRSDKICELTYARLQGLSKLIEHFQNSKVLNDKDQRYQPIIKTVRQCKRIQTLIKQQKSEQSTLNV